MKLSGSGFDILINVETAAVAPLSNENQSRSAPRRRDTGPVSGTLACQHSPQQPAPVRAGCLRSYAAGQQFCHDGETGTGGAGRARCREGGIPGRAGTHRKVVAAGPWWPQRHRLMLPAQPATPVLCMMAPLRQPSYCDFWSFSSRFKSYTGLSNATSEVFSTRGCVLCLCVCAASLHSRFAFDTCTFYTY